MNSGYTLGAIALSLVLIAPAGCKKTETTESSSTETTTMPAGGDLTATGATTTETAATTSMASGDSDFATKAAKGGMGEVEMGKLVVQKAKSPEVKAFGQRMIDDHSKANEQLTGILQSKGITAPAEMSDDHKQLQQKLSTLSGSEFDKEYIKAMVADHEKDIADFESEANGGADPELKNFASQTLPTLREHLQLARDTEAKLK